MSQIIRTRIDERLTELAPDGVTAKSVSLAIGASRTFVSDFLSGRAKTMSIDKLEALARELKTTPQYLMGDAQSPGVPQIRKTMPVRGRAAASAIGAENILEDPIEWMPVPVGMVGVRDGYALLVEGDSMKPLYRPRDPIFVHPRQPVSHGDIIVIQEERDGAIYASVKEFITRTDTELVVRQYNPEATLTFKLRHVRAVHRVLPWREVLDI